VTEEQIFRKHECLGLECSIAAAIVGGAAISGIGSLVGGAEQASAANNAASIQQQQYQQTLQNQQPYMQAGQTALNTIGQDQANGTGFAASFNPSTYIDTPGYQFQLQQGQNAINSSAAATGGVLNGGTLKALDQYTTGLANTTYGQAYSQYLQNSQQQYNQLYGVASLGENATASTGQAGANAANATGNYLTQAGNAEAAGTVGAASGINQGINNGLLYSALQSSQSGYAQPTTTGVPYPQANLGGQG
jgi:hypothetical protein